MRFIQQGMLESAEDRKKFKKAPRFVPAGQSTQVIIGATNDTDKQILTLASALYKRPSFKRMYYSGYIPVNTEDSRLPVLAKPPLVRENRLYQADWLMRFYEFQAHEIVDDTQPDLDLDVDPKMGWALRHPEFFPIDVNVAPYEMILRVPGIGVKSAQLIVASRRYGRLNSVQLKKMGVVMKRAQYFIANREIGMQTVNELTPQYVRRQVTEKQRKQAADLLQYSIDWGE
jgi:predicted DNA-binding helix-hairpin-helix protein